MVLAIDASLLNEVTHLVDGDQPEGSEKKDGVC